MRSCTARESISWRSPLPSAVRTVCRASGTGRLYGRESVHCRATGRNRPEPKHDDGHYSGNAICNLVRSQQEVSSK